MSGILSYEEIRDRCAIEIMARQFTELEVINPVSLKEIAKNACDAADALVIEMQTRSCT